MVGKRNNSGCRTSELAGWKPVVFMAIAFLVVTPAFLGLLLWESAPVVAQEYIRDQEPVPDPEGRQDADLYRNARNFHYIVIGANSTAGFSVQAALHVGKLKL